MFMGHPRWSQVWLEITLGEKWFRRNGVEDIRFRTMAGRRTGSVRSEKGKFDTTSRAASSSQSGEQVFKVPTCLHAAPHQCRRQIFRRQLAPAPRFYAAKWVLTQVPRSCCLV